MTRLLSYLWDGSDLTLEACALAWFSIPVLMLLIQHVGG